MSQQARRGDRPGGRQAAHQRLVDRELVEEVLLRDQSVRHVRLLDRLDWGGSGGDAGLLVLACAVLLEDVGRETLHTEDLDVVAVSTRKCVLQPEESRSELRESAFTNDGERSSDEGRTALIPACVPAGRGQPNLQPTRHTRRPGTDQSWVQKYAKTGDRTVLSFLGHRRHLKCFAFWCCIRTVERQEQRVRGTSAYPSNVEEVKPNFDGKSNAPFSSSNSRSVLCVGRRREGRGRRERSISTRPDDSST